MPRHTPIKQEDEWFTGTDKTLSYVVLDAEGVPVDIDGWALAWRMFRIGAQAGTPALIEKTTVSGITVQDAVSVSSMAVQLARRGIDTTGWAATVAVAEVTIADTDTDDMAPSSDYEYELRRTDAGSEDVIAYGRVELLRSAVR